MSIQGRTIADASPAYLRMAAIVSGVLSLIGVWASIYVYLKFPHPAVVEHAGRFSISTESFESYIFSYPAFQIVIFVILTIQSLRWPTVLRRNIELEASQKAKNPRLQQLDSILLYNFTCVLIVIVEVGLLGLTIHHASVVATNSF
jgi:hypothetical protein